MPTVELVIFLIPLIAMTYTVVERNVFPQASTARYLRAVTQYGVKGVILRNPNMVLVPGCFIASHWYIPLGLYWAVLGALLLCGAVLVMVSKPTVSALPAPDMAEFEQLSKRRQWQTLMTASVGFAWFLSWQLA